ncbi:serpin family protein [Parapedobacter sp. 10938]|uniref:serpin family protein n=1 Tax=Parapedobacter flavus TaxID=3110225 RepID=UPI002DB8932E|nr:serpin family protein [Parapedobacter sp. 10938]MEC3881469.1 serpin family protein [Parapedobacter sp. 10938]
MNRFATYGMLLAGATATSLAACEKANPEKLGQGKDLILTAVEQEKAESDNRFAFEFFRTATGSLGTNENAMLSPLSVGMALAMTHNGAIGETRNAIEKALKFDGFDAAAINAYYRKLVADLPQLDPRTTLDIANSIWYRQGFDVLPGFLEVNREFYKAEVNVLDFADPDAPDVINDWVSKKTKKKIPTIIEGGIPGDMMMYLINAVYFKGAWEQRFDKKQTEKGTFTRADGTTLQTDFMRVKHTFNVAATDVVEAIELPYGDKRFSMVVLKPRDGVDLMQLSEKLADGDLWDKLASSFYSRETQLALPRFKFSYENKLNDELTDMGMGIAFTPAADFSGISSAPLAISEVKHKSFIEVNEEGTEAAAVTSVGMVMTSLPQAYTFDVNRPFLFAIREMNTGLILFIGQVNDPSVEATKG